MAGLIDPNDIAKARQSGYSDAEISTFLADKHPDQFKAAREAGYSDKEILSHLAPAAAEPSGIAAGIAAGFAHGAAGVASGDASTIGLTGAKTDGLDTMAAATEPKDYHAAPLIREGGHWYNPADYQPSAIPQMLAEAAPGLGQDAAAGWAASKIPGSPAVKAMAGLGGFAGSQLLRTFGPGAHANADARTGVPNSPVETPDLTREAAKQAILAPINMIPASRFLPAVTKAGGSALAKYLVTAGEGAGSGLASDAVEQLGTTAGSKEGIKYDPNQAATSTLTRALGSAALATPRLASDAIGNAKYGKIEADPDTKAAATALANRYTDAADGRNMVGPLGGTKVAQEVKASTHADIHNELADAAKSEDNLSQGSANVLDRIKSGGTATPTELKALADEADPATVHLARQALLSANVKDTGGLSGAMDKLTPISSPLRTILGTGAAAAAGHSVLGGVIGHVAAPVLAGLYGTYGAARAFDKMSGARSPVQGFTDRFADANVPVRTPEAVPAEPAPATTSVPQVTPPQDTALWGNTAPKPAAGPTPAAQAADIRGLLLMAAARRKAAEANAQPAPPPAAPAPPELSPVAMMMLKQKLKQGLPPAPAPTEPQAGPPEAPPAASPEAFDALKPLMGRQRAIMRGLAASSKQQIADNAAQRKAAGISQAEGLAGDSHLINDNGGLDALSNPEFTKRGSQLISAANVMKKLTAQPKEDAAAVSDGPASPLIAQVMAKMNGHAAAPAAPAPVPPAAPPAPAPAAPPPTSMANILSRVNGAPAAPAAPEMPQAPIIAKISKKAEKPIVETPHPEEMQPYAPIPPEGLYRSRMTDDDMVAHEFAKYTPSKKEAYGEKAKSNRENNREDTLGLIEAHPTDAGQLTELYHQLDHTHDRVQARKARDHYSAKMSPAAALAVREKFTPEVIAHRWKERK